MTTLVDKHTAVRSMMLNAVGSGKHMLVFNGRIQRHNDAVIHVRNNEGNLLFYTITKHEGGYVEQPQERFGITFIDKATQSILFDFNFTEWVRQYSARDNVQYFSARVSNDIRTLFVESDIYRIFRSFMERRSSLSDRFTAEIKDGSDQRIMTPIELTRLITDFNLNGFRSVNELVQSKYLRSVQVPNNLRLLYRRGMILTNVNSPLFYNPFFDDKIIFNTIKDRLVMKHMLAGRLEVKNVDNADLYFMTGVQMSESVGFSIYLKLNFKLFYNMLVGLVIDPRMAGEEFPHKDVQAWRTNYTDLDQTITNSEWQSLPAGTRDLYTRTNSLVNFFISNYGYIRKTGFDNPNKLIEVIQDARLI